MGDVDWTNELVIRLMREYQKRPELWDTGHEMYRVQTLKYESWSELASMFECDIADLRKKLNSVFASHRREKAKVRGGARSSWFLYPHMSFLPSHLECADSGPDAHMSQYTPKREKPQRMETVTSSDDDAQDYDDSPSAQEELLIKNEPVVEEYVVRPRVKKQLTHKPRLVRPPKRRIVKEYTTSHLLDSRLSEALKLLRKSDLSRKKDECDSFGEYIADSLRKHDERTQSMIKQAINNILFEQEMKKYSTSNQCTVIISGIDENPLILGDDNSDK